MQDQPRYSLMRRLLFPYSGEVPLTRTQGMRVIIVWALFFAFVLSFCSMPILLAMAALSLQKVVLLLLISLLSGAFVFGGLAWVVVSMSNRAARFRQQREAASTGSTGGGRYGS